MRYLFTFFLFVFEQIFYSADASHEVCCLVRQIYGLGLVALGYLLQHLYIFLCQEVVGGVCRLAHRLGYFLYGDGLCLRLSYSCLRFAFSL